MSENAYEGVITDVDIVSPPMLVRDTVLLELCVMFQRDENLRKAFYRHAVDSDTHGPGDKVRDRLERKLALKDFGLVVRPNVKETAYMAGWAQAAVTRIKQEKETKPELDEDAYLLDLLKLEHDTNTPHGQAG